MRECARVILPKIRDVCVKQGLGLDISLRYRTPLLVRGDITVAQAKDNVRRSTELAIAALFKRLKTIKLDSEVNP